MDSSTTLFAFDVADAHLPSAITSAPVGNLLGREDSLEENEGPAADDSEQTDVNDIRCASTARIAIGTSFRANSTTEFVESCAGTPPISIVMSKSASQDRVAEKSEKDFEQTITNNTPTLDHHMTSKNASRKKKRAQKKSALAALSTVRGFTPATSADDDSDFSSHAIRGRKEPATQRSSSVVRKDLNLQGLSPGGPRPETRSSSPSGYSALSQQLESMRSRSPSLRPSETRKKSKLASETPSSASVTSETDCGDDDTQITSYEVRL